VVHSCDSGSGAGSHPAKPEALGLIQNSGNLMGAVWSARHNETEGRPKKKALELQLYVLTWFRVSVSSSSSLFGALVSVSCCFSGDDDSTFP